MGAIENFRSESPEGSIDRFLDAHNARLSGWQPGDKRIRSSPSR
jgi:hypothetical protein